MPKTFTVIQTNVGTLAGDTSTSFATKIGVWINNRHRDILMRCHPTHWTSASIGDLAGGSYPTLECGDLLEVGALADAWAAKRQFRKAAYYENKYEFGLKNLIIAEPQVLPDVSLSRWGYHG